MIAKYQLESYQHLLLDKRAALERAVVVNEEKTKLQAQMNELTELQNKCYSHLLNLETLLKIVMKEDANFRERRIAFLNEHITKELLKIFPAEGYQAKIYCDPKRGAGNAFLVLVDKNGKERIPKVTEGKLCQYLISFASTVGVVQGLNTDNIYIDEAFGVASEGNLPKVGEILKNTAKDGVQIVLVSQNSALYRDIPRREIHLRLSPVTNSSNIEQVIDY